MQFPEQAPHKERWRELCAQAVVESNPERLDHLIEQIFALLQERERHLNHGHIAR